MGDLWALKGLIEEGMGNDVWIKCYIHKVCYFYRPNKPSERD